MADPARSDAERIERIMAVHPALLPPEAIELRAAVVQLRYERQLLGAAREVLDRVATGGLRDWANAQRQAKDLAQRIVDEIGHPVTDEPALGPEYRAEIRQLRADMAEARSDLAGWRAAYQALSLKTRRFWNAWRSARRGRRRERDKARRLREITRAVQKVADEWEETITSGVMRGQEWERCLRANLTSLRAALPDEEPASW